MIDFFSIKGFGTVVTGTIISGSLNIGEEIFVQPIDKSVKVRSIQSHNSPIKEAKLGQRTSVNIHGLGKSDIYRGCQIVEKNYFKGINVFLDGLVQNDLELIRIGMKINFPYVSLLLGTSYSDGYGDIAYGLSFAYNNFELAIGNLNHENPILGSPLSLQFKYYINKNN